MDNSIIVKLDINVLLIQMLNTLVVALLVAVIAYSIIKYVKKIRNKQ